jgi:hypothetical protein
MDDAIKSSVYVTSPEFAGWLMKKGFRVSLVVVLWYCVYCRALTSVSLMLCTVEESVEEALGRFTRIRNCVHG